MAPPSSVGLPSPQQRPGRHGNGHAITTDWTRQPSSPAFAGQNPAWFSIMVRKTTWPLCVAQSGHSNLPQG